jgi:tetrahydromethanopterin S-methyltransferase subunit G
MKKVLRTIFGIVAGLVVGFVLVIAVELFSAVVHPVPEGFGGTMEEMCQHVERYPRWVLAVVVPVWSVTALLSTWTARRIGNLYSAAIVGLLLIAGLAFNVSKLPYPMWFKVATLIAIPIAAIAGGRLFPRHMVNTPDIQE